MSQSFVNLEYNLFKYRIKISTLETRTQKPRNIFRFLKNEKKNHLSLHCCIKNVITFY